MNEYYIFDEKLMSETLIRKIGIQGSLIKAEVISGYFKKQPEVADLFYEGRARLLTTDEYVKYRLLID